MRSKEGGEGRHLLLQAQGQYITAQDGSLVYREALEVIMQVGFSPNFFSELARSEFPTNTQLQLSW